MNIMFFVEFKPEFYTLFAGQLTISFKGLVVKGLRTLLRIFSTIHRPTICKVIAGHRNSPARFVGGCVHVSSQIPDGLLNTN